jgi:surface polysaccharide O-acyltransferase-like enzyme
MKERKANYIYMEYLRVLCAFMVIMIHVSGADWFKIEIGSPDWIIQTFFNVGARFSVCVFCMISGALFLKPDREVTVRDIFGKYIRRIMICFIAWTVFYAAFYTFLDSGDAEYFLLRLFKIPKHLWYLLMMVGLYLALPVLKVITKDRRITLYMIWLLLIYAAVFGTLEGLTVFFKTKAAGNLGFTLWEAFLQDLYNLNMTFVPGYLGLFLMGHYIHEYGLGRWHRPLVFCAVPALLLSGLLTVITSRATGSYVYTFMFETNPLIAAASAGIFAFFKGTGSGETKESTGSFWERAAVRTGAYTMGIYLVHVAVLDVFEHYFSLTVASYPPLLSVPLNSLLVFAVSLAVTAVLKKIPLIRNTVS